jgi:hypothetical protein
MNGRTIGYWAATGLVAVAFAAGAAMDLSGNPEILATLGHLGYRPYFATLLGVWKLLAVVAILAPRFPRLKEWAYAGIVFDLTGAIVSHLAVGDRVGDVVAPVVLLGLAAASWSLRPESRATRAHETGAAPESRAHTDELPRVSAA